MTRYVLRDGVLVEKRLAPPAYASAFVISDHMDAAAHPVTGEMMDSKSAFRRVTRQAGCIEVGNESFPERRDTYDAREVKRDIAHAMRNPNYRTPMTERAFERLQGR